MYTEDGQDPHMRQASLFSSEQTIAASWRSFSTSSASTAIPDVAALPLFSCTSAMAHSILRLLLQSDQQLALSGIYAGAIRHLQRLCTGYWCDGWPCPGCAVGLSLGQGLLVHCELDGVSGGPRPEVVHPSLETRLQCMM